MKKIIFPIIKILTSILTIPLWFIEFFVGIGHMPNVDTGKIEEVRFYHSMYENISDMDLGLLFYLAVILCLSSAVLSILTIKVSNKRLYKISNVVFIVTISSFLLFLLIASAVARGY